MERSKRLEDRQQSRSERSIRLASNLGTVLSSRGLVFSTFMRNRLSSGDLGLILPLNANPDEPLYLGMVR